MGRIIFITGGARSGKSRFASEVAKAISDKDVLFIATCVPQDDEMKARVLEHRRARPAGWKTVEAGQEILKELQKIDAAFKVVIIDCLTLFVSGLLMRGEKEEALREKTTNIVDHLSKAPYISIVVSNEVGAGIVPENRLARGFRDLAGIANQIVANRSNEAYLIVAGVPMKIK